MIWNGGTFFPGIASIDVVCQVRDFYHNLGIPLKLTLTNPLLTKEDCYDRYCNKIVELFETGENEILVASPILEEYLRKKYPNYKFNRSIVASKDDVNYEDLLDRYSMIVLPRRKIKDFDFLNSIAPENRSRFELLCTDPCPIDCPRLYTHYEDYARTTLYETSPRTPINKCSTFDAEDAVIQKMAFAQYQISYQEIIEKYVPLGFTEFKISGRGSAQSALFAVLPFLIQPQYQLAVAQYILYRVTK